MAEESSQVEAYLCALENTERMSGALGACQVEEIRTDCKNGQTMEVEKNMGWLLHFHGWDV